MQTSRGDPRQRLQIGPLVLERLQALVHKQRVATLAGLLLQRQRDEVPEASLRQRVLAWEQAVVGRHPQRGTARHRVGQKHQPEPPRERCQHRLAEEEPDMGALPRARALDCRDETELAACLAQRHHIRTPRAFIEIDRQQPTHIAGQQRIDAHHMAAPQMPEQLTLIRDGERLVGTFTTLHAWLVASVLPLVVAAGRPPALALRQFLPAMREDVLATTKETGEQLDLALRRPRCCPIRLILAPTV